MKPNYREPLLLGVSHFNARRFWEAHEAWEELWLAAESDVVEFLQGLIQLAAAYHHIQRGTFRGAPRLIDAALRRLSAFPPVFSGIDRSFAEACAARDRERAVRAEVLGDDDYPKLHLVDENESRIPPRDDW